MISINFVVRLVYQSLGDNHGHGQVLMLSTLTDAYRLFTERWSISIRCEAASCVQSICIS